VALLLKRRGITRVRPLLGGFDAWRKRGYPVEQKLVQLNDALAEPQPSQQSDQAG
jgi:3-mercaptopyruvate sulfurtransferase SseA